jgi:hypothetical protein
MAKNHFFVGCQALTSDETIWVRAAPSGKRNARYRAVFATLAEATADAERRNEATRQAYGSDRYTYRPILASRGTPVRAPFDAPVKTPYDSASAATLRKIIGRAYAEHDFHESWRAPRTSDREELISHIDAMCCERGLVPDELGYLCNNS